MFFWLGGACFSPKDRSLRHMIKNTTPESLRGGYDNEIFKMHQVPYLHIIFRGAVTGYLLTLVTGAYIKPQKNGQSAFAGDDVPPWGNNFCERGGKQRSPTPRQNLNTTLVETIPQRPRQSSRMGISPHRRGCSRFCRTFPDHNCIPSALRTNAKEKPSFVSTIKDHPNDDHSKVTSCCCDSPNHLSRNTIKTPMRHCATVGHIP